MTHCECDCCQHWKAERGDLSAELAVERERADAHEKWAERLNDEGVKLMHQLEAERERYAKLEAENARLRELVKNELGPMLFEETFPSD